MPFVTDTTNYRSIPKGLKIATARLMKLGLFISTVVKYSTFIPMIEAVFTGILHVEHIDRGRALYSEAALRDLSHHKILSCT